MQISSTSGPSRANHVSRLDGELDSFVHEILRKDFGYEAFRPGQYETTVSTLERRDNILVLRTSDGKSLSYQLPAVAQHRLGMGTTVVISPLIALMRDQVEKLYAKEIPCCFFDSFQTREEKNAEWKKLFSGECAMVYVSPERFVTTSFQDALLGLRDDSNRIKVPRVVIDETHVIWQWGHDFRFSYGQKLGAAIERLGRPPVTVCSATVTEDIRFDVQSVLNLKDPFFYEAEFDRPNLFYDVTRFYSQQEKLDQLVTTLLDDKRRYPQDHPNHGFESTVVYVAARKIAERIAEHLRKFRIPAVAYHAGMERDDRLANQSRFMDDISPIIVATNAFGMGIDKSNIRRVIFFHIPRSLEEFTQGVGRSGRDGRPSRCELWYQPEDLYRQMYFIASSNPSRAYIRKVYDMLVKWFPAAEMRMDIPTTFIDFRKFFDKEGDYAVFTPRKQAAFTWLVEQGAIDVDGWMVSLLVKPHAIESVLPTEEATLAKLERDYLSLKIINYFAKQTGGDKRHRHDLNAHFRHDALVDKVKAQKLSKQIGVSNGRIIEVLRLVAEQDYEMVNLIGTLKKNAMGRRASTSAAEFRQLTRLEIRNVIRHAAYCGYLRMPRRGRKSLVVMSQGGIDAVKAALKTDKLLIDPKKLEPSQTFKELGKRLGHAAERDQMRKILRKWYTEQYRNGNDEVLKRARQNFLKSKFSIFGESVTGRTLVSLFNHSGEEEISLRDVRDFLNLFFDDPTDTRADRNAAKTRARRGS